MKRLTPTDRGLLEMRINRLASERYQLSRALLSSVLSGQSEVNWDEVETGLIRLGSSVSLTELSDLYLGTENLEECKSTLDRIDGIYSDLDLEYDREGLKDFTNFKRYILSITDNTGIVEELSENQIEALKAIADQFTGRAATQARNLLCFHAGLCEELDLSLQLNSSDTKNMHNSEIELTVSDESDRQLQVVPNPNKGEFELTVPTECSIYKVQITNTQGKRVDFEVLEEKAYGNRIVIPHCESGMFLLTVTCIDGSVFTTRLIVNN